MFTGKRWWIIGASEGLGRALALALAREGAQLVVSARNRDRLAALLDEMARFAPDTARTAQIVVMDVTDTASVAQAVAQAMQEAGPPDGLIYAAGAYAPMRAQDWNAQTAETVCDVNFMGAMRVLGRLVPDMAARNRGHIALIGSLAGYTGLPGAIGYGASKAALMHLGENLHRDLRDTALRVQVINPGYIRTRLTAQNDFAMPMMMSPEDAADACLRALRRRRFASAFPAPFAWVFRVARHLPRSLVSRLI